MTKFEIDKLIETIKRIQDITKILINNRQDFTHPIINTDRSNGINTQSSESIDIDPADIHACDAATEPYINNNDLLERLLESTKKLSPNLISEQDFGIEALAWYKSFHRTDHWGIYIPYSGLLRMASHFRPCVRNATTAVKIAWRALMAHELIHFAIDVASARAEILTNTSVYLAGQAKFRSPQGHIPDEECIAQGSFLRTLNGFTRGNEFAGELANRYAPYLIAKDLTSRLPSGYRDGLKSQKIDDFLSLTNSYLQQLISVNFLAGSPTNLSVFEASSLLPFAVEERGRLSLGKIDPTQCKVYVFDDLKLHHGPTGCMHFISAVNHIRESDYFMGLVRPDHIRKWLKTKEQLGNPAIPKYNSNLDFKRWEKDDDLAANIRAWSVRVGGQRSNYRAHLDQDIASGRWTAVKFGDGDKLGHHKTRK
jgi:hypothetical protein